MRKLCLIAICICLIGTFTACGNEKPKSEEEAVNENDEAVQRPEILSLCQSYDVQNEWQEDIRILYSKYSDVTMWEGSEIYPEMDRTLSELANMQARSREDEVDNLLSFAQEILDVDVENFEPQISTLDVQVRRADSVVVSLLSDSYADYGFIEDFRGMWGSNYDVRTGKELLLSDVVVDMDAIPGIVLQEINSHIWAGDFYSEAVVEEYFKNTPIDGISWTLDYNGVTFYFSDGDLAEFGNGRVSATVSFEQYPELFDEKYMNVPEAYMVRLPLDQSFFTDLDADGTLDELNCSGLFNETDRCYTMFGVYTNRDGHYHYEDLFAYQFQPYYVKTEDGKHYIYLFCEESEDTNRQMRLVVYEVTGGIFARTGDMNIAPAYIPSDIFVVPLNPNNMLLDHYDSPMQDAEVFMVGRDGMPVKK